ncbi:peptidase T [Liquorilactobacillus ghanensis DSM 18630]|uniref:Peptidase T n=1 Tax=Liquorilactobacillus ghanensis DSM 18630 TaxID=1423750 RepID=A0A0R1VRA2_9LACO|nr:peptidase T [Liquorilactobacillus ghanensis]KRM08279.1 peptidase T [Liquorilactobacillus ghanensis DSM 18630]
MSYQNLVPRFIKYAKQTTRSDENSATIPSTKSQSVFAHQLVAELQQIGLSQVHISTKSAYVLATLPTNLPATAEVPKIGLIAHMDTADFNAENVQPQIQKNYDGKATIPLAKSGYYLDPAEFPNLKNYAGEDLITTDGTTLLGADDKAGIAEIITAAEYLLAHPEIKHGTIQIGIGPDEEIGKGADNFDVTEFPADFAYTVDGGPLGELEYETFNAAQAKIKLIGKNVHPGTAKDVMVNALQLAFDFQAQLPADEVPEKTAGRQGFFHLIDLNGTVDQAEMTYIIRDHDRSKFESRKELLQQIAARMNAEYGEERVVLEVTDQYYNMREVIEKDMTSVKLAQTAMEKLKIKPIIYPVRGGTDGSKISFMGLPTPNLFAGGENMHSRFEFVSVQVMERAVDVILQIIKSAVHKAK